MDPADFYKRYGEWIRYVFDRPITPNGWYFDIDDDEEEYFNPEPLEMVHLFEETCRRSGTDLLLFSDEQLAAGFWYIFSNSCSDTLWAFVDKSVPTKERIQALQSIPILYRDCFTQRCEKVLSHLDEPVLNPLNMICYMLWDVSIMTCWGEYMVEILEECLQIDHLACIESTLHGLGHMHLYTPNLVESVIDHWLEKEPNLPGTLREYAENARWGMVQ